ncbi:MAG: hypothetical protein IJL03_07085 [Lachnospiraceae bacterium]|nr:hypothetical protein [Lachnospiraceae bacterium]
MYTIFNATSVARKEDVVTTFRPEPKPVRESNLKNDAIEIEKYLRFLKKNPNPTAWQIRKHLKENDMWMSVLDNRINDCEHIIALATFADVDEETLKQAHEILTDALGTRMRLKGHRQECLYKLNNTSQPFEGLREYRVRTLHEPFGRVVTVENGAMVFHP